MKNYTHVPFSMMIGETVSKSIKDQQTNNYFYLYNYLTKKNMININ